jgi:TetR/AcrR family fatty acid metabolism transcriptional regulator
MARRGPRGGGTAKRERILRAAIRIFSQKGYFNSKISEIARQAGVADGTIYLYFKNKDDLLISLFEEKMGEVVADIRARVSDGSARSPGCRSSSGTTWTCSRGRRASSR